MSETAFSLQEISQALSALLEALRPSVNGLGHVALYKEIARRLSVVARKQPPWGWRYIQGVEKGTIAPSHKLALHEAETKRENAQVELAPQALRIALDTWQARLAGAQGKGDLLTVKNFLARFFSKIEVGYHTVRVVYTYPAEPNDG